MTTDRSSGTDELDRNHDRALDVAIRGAVRELRAAAPPPLTFDELRVRPVSPSVGRPAGGVAVATRSLAVAAAVLLFVGGLWAVRRTDANHRATSAGSTVSTVPSTSSDSSAAPVALSADDAVRHALAAAWHDLVTPLLPVGVTPILTDAVDENVVLYAGDGDGRLMQVWVTTDVEFLAKSKDSAIRTLPVGDVFDTGRPTAPGRWVHTRSGRVVGVETCALEPLSLTPGSGEPSACDGPPGGLDASSVEALAVGLAEALAVHPIDAAAAPPHGDDQQRMNALVEAARAVPGGTLLAAPGNLMWLASERAFGTVLTMSPEGSGSGDTVTIDLRVFRRTAAVSFGGDFDVAGPIVGHPAPDAVSVQYGPAGGPFVVVRAIGSGDPAVRAWLASAEPDFKAYAGRLADALDRVDAAESGRPAASVLDAASIPIPVAYGPASQHWLAVVAPLLPTGFHAVTAWSWHNFSSGTYVESVADDGRWLTVSVTIGGGSEARREINGVGDPTAWTAVPEGELQKADMVADLVTPAGDVVHAECRRGQSSCRPGTPGADALGALVQGAARTMDRERARVTDVDAAADPIPPVTCAQFAGAPSLRGLRQLGDVSLPTRHLFCSWEGPLSSTITVDVALRAAPGGTALGIRRAALLDGAVSSGQASAGAAYLVVNATVGNTATITDATASVLTPLVEQITVDLAGEESLIARALTGVDAAASVAATSTPTAAPVLTAPPDPCADDPACGGSSTSTSVAPATYTVVEGDYLVGIAQKLGVTLVALLDENDLATDSLIVPGQNLAIPPSIGTRPMRVGRDGGLPQRLADRVLMAKLPAGFVLHAASYGRSSADLMTFGAGADDDRRQVVVVAVHAPTLGLKDGGPASGANDASPLTAPVVTGSSAAGGERSDEGVTSASHATLAGTSGWRFEASAIDVDGGAPPLSDGDLAALLAAMDAAAVGG